MENIGGPGLKDDERGEGRHGSGDRWFYPMDLLATTISGGSRTLVGWFLSATFYNVLLISRRCINRNHVMLWYSTETGIQDCACVSGCAVGESCWPFRAEDGAEPESGSILVGEPE